MSPKKPKKRKANVVHAITLTREGEKELAQVISQGDGFQVIGPSDFPSDLASSLREKFDSATRIVSGSDGPMPLVLYNFRRIDGGDVDEHPFGAVLISGSVAVSSSLLDHGDWNNRTTKISPQHAAQISGSGIGSYFLVHPPQGIGSGSLDQLSRTDGEALRQFVKSVVEGDDPPPV